MPSTGPRHEQPEEVDAIEAASSLLFSSLDAEMTADGDGDAKQGSPLGAVGVLFGGIVLLLGGGYLMRGQIQARMGNLSGSIQIPERGLRCSASGQSSLWV